MADEKSKKEEPVVDGEFVSSADVLETLDTEPLNTEGVKVPATPAKVADQSADTGSADAEADDPPVRAALPDTPILGSLPTGAGQHVPTDDPNIGPDGRPSPQKIHEASLKQS